MAVKIFSGIVASILLIAFLAPVVIKLKEVALGVVVIIGIALMAWDLWESLQSTDD